MVTCTVHTPFDRDVICMRTAFQVSHSVLLHKTGDKSAPVLSFLFTGPSSILRCYGMQCVPVSVFAAGPSVLYGFSAGCSERLSGKCNSGRLRSQCSIRATIFLRKLWKATLKCRNASRAVATFLSCTRGARRELRRACARNCSPRFTSCQERPTCCRRSTSAQVMTPTLGETLHPAAP